MYEYHQRCRPTSAVLKLKYICKQLIIIVHKTPNDCCVVIRIKASSQYTRAYCSFRGIHLIIHVFRAFMRK